MRYRILLFNQLSAGIVSILKKGRACHPPGNPQHWEAAETIICQTRAKIVVRGPIQRCGCIHIYPQHWKAAKSTNSFVLYTQMLVVCVYTPTIIHTPPKGCVFATYVLYAHLQNIAPNEGTDRYAE